MGVEQEASNPQTPATRLYELAIQDPQLWGSISANPAVYPELRDWISAQQAKRPSEVLPTVEDEANNPNTSAARLYELASEFPYLWDAISANPAVYPELRDWIGAQRAVPAEAIAEEIDENPAQDIQEEPVAEVKPLAAPIESQEAEQPEPLADDTVELASSAEATDPQTSQARLAELAGSHLELHPQIYTNPNAYHELRDWIRAVSPSVYLSGSAILGLRAEVQDPETSAARLQGLAAEHQFLHADIAAHPQAYDQLLAWLGEVNAPGVAQALNNR